MVLPKLRPTLTDIVLINIDIYLNYVFFEKKFSGFCLVVLMYRSRFLVCYANMIAYASFVNSLGCGFAGITKLQLL